MELTEEWGSAGVAVVVVGGSDAGFRRRWQSKDDALVIGRSSLEPFGRTERVVMNKTPIHSS